MQRKKIKLGTVLLVIMLVAIASGCGTIKVETPAPGNIVKEKTPEGDYLAEDVVLAPFMWEDGGFSETTYYPSKILTEASEETNNEYEVKCLIGDFDVAEGETMWTKNVILESHPAKKEEFKEDMIALYTEKPVKEGLDEARWNRGIISSTDELYKDMVQIDHVWHLDKSYELIDRRTYL